MKREELARLKIERRKRIIALRTEGLLNSEIAVRLGMSERAVATLIYRARQDGMAVPRSPFYLVADQRRPRS